MKYIVITSKHHDGFAMFDIEGQRLRHRRRTPYQRDPMKALAEAAKRQGMMFASTTRSWTGTIPTQCVEHPDAITAGSSTKRPQEQQAATSRRT